MFFISSKSLDRPSEPTQLHDLLQIELANVAPIIEPPLILPKASATYRSPLVSISMGQELLLPFLPCLAPLSLMFFSTSGRLGIYIAVSARPVIGVSLTV